MDEKAYPMLLGRTAAAQLTGISVRTLDRLRKTGVVRCFRTPGGQNRFHKSSLLDYIRQNTHLNPAETTYIHHDGR